MSTLDKLIALKAITIDNTGEDLYERDPDGDDTIYQDTGIKVIARIGDDDDPKYTSGYGWGEHRNSIVVEYEGQLFKSNSFSGSYGRSQWTEWELVNEVKITRYYYDESTY